MTMFNRLRHGPLKVCVIGGGNWGTAAAQICAMNAARSYVFQDEVLLWAMEKELEDWINNEQENKLYLPGIKLPPNLKCSSDLAHVAKLADLLVVVIPHQFCIMTCKKMEAHVKRTCQAISLIKGLHINAELQIPQTSSMLIQEILKVPCASLSGANVAKDVALKQFSESTIGFDLDNADVAPIWQQLFDTEDMKVRCIPDKYGVEVNGAIKNVVAIASGFCDGLGLGTNTKGAIIRIGAQESRLFCALFFPTASTAAFFESCGFADLITTCFGGRNVRCAAEFAKRGGGSKTSWNEIEKEMLGGQFLQGTLATKEVYEVLKYYNIEDFFPLFKTTYSIAYENLSVQAIIDVFRTTEPSRSSIMTSSEFKANSIMIPAGLKTKLGSNSRFSHL